MVDILHRAGIRSSSVDAAYKALTTREGLSGWWTTDTQGDGSVGGVLQFRFGVGDPVSRPQRDIRQTQKHVCGR